MKIEIENLKALLFGKELTNYQRSLAITEYRNLITYIEHLEENNQKESENHAILKYTKGWVEGFQSANEERKKEAFQKFIEQQEDISPEIQELINKNFWELF